MNGDAKPNVCGCSERVRELREENKRLRKIAAHVPAAVYIAAKEAAGYGEQVRTKTPNVVIGGKNDCV